MTRRSAIFLTLMLLAGPVLPGSAAAQNSAAAIVQQIHDVAYGKCMEAGRFGSGSELQGNCSCSADVAINLLSEEFKQAIADGTQASFAGAKLAGDELSRNVTLLKSCPKIGAYLQQQCAGDPGNPHCQVLQRALEQAQ
ncbi:hypothetical protein [Dongia sedimenti]|uniref:Uncharacterized protein n=1 Tax=Dongia sedimenti TaxID=3064282 RepID=A0ABU0YSS4_9PROT|nr:hypothetical protein [Rhodospirillaceae bacterium R-7]